MASENKGRFFLAVLAAACTAVLVYFGTGLDPRWPLMWLAPLPVLWFAARSSWWAAGLTSMVGWTAGVMNQWNYFNHLLHMPAGVQISIFGGTAVLFAASVLLFRALLRRGALWSAMLAFPATWVTFEYVNNLTSPHGTAGSLAYSQLNFVPFLQLASVTGPWGMSFVLLLFSASVTVGISARGKDPKRAGRIAMTGVGIALVVLVFGAVRLSMKPPAQQVKVGLIASDAAQNDWIASKGSKTERLLTDYAKQAEGLAKEGAQVIVIPEKLGIVDASTVNQADAILQPVADQTGAMIVAGVVEESGGASYNRARIYRPNSAVMTYDKHHMLPPFESYLKPGTTVATMREGSQTWGVEICKDMDFTPLSRKYGEADAGLVLAPAWDFNVDRIQHGHISIMRGVESGFSLVRAAKNGYLTVTDDRGRVLAEARSDSAPFATLLANVPVRHDTTVYLLLGDWFAWVAIALFGFSCVQLYRVRKSRLEQKTTTPPILSAA